MGDVVSLDDRRPSPQRGGNKKGQRRSFGNVRQPPSKEWQPSYQGPDGKRHNAPTTFQTKGDANTWLSMQSAAITEHRWKPAAPKETAETLAEFTERWLAGRATGAMGLKPLSPRTVAEYERMSKSFTGGALGAKALPKVTSADVRAWHAAQDPSKATTRAHTYALLRTVLNSAVEEELIPDNPAKIRGAGTTKSSVAIKPASVAEVQRIADAMPERYRAMVHIAAWCALRYGELTELRRKDVDMTEGVIHVTRGVTWVKDDEGKAAARVGAPKTAAGVRAVHIPPHIMPIHPGRPHRHVGQPWPRRSAVPQHRRCPPAPWQPLRGLQAGPCSRWAPRPAVA